MPQSNSIDRLVISAHKPFHKLKLCCLVALTAAISFWAGRWDSWHELRQTHQKAIALNLDVEELSNSLSLLRDEHTRLTADLEVQKATEKLVRQENKRMQNEVFMMTKDLKLYQKILSPNSNVSGTKIAKIEIVPAAVEDHYRFSITLIQENGAKKLTQGRLTGNLVGQTQEGAPTSIELAKVVLNRANLQFKFRYLQVLTGELVLPNGFKPDNLQFSVSHKNGRQQQAMQSFHWVVKEAIYHVEEQRKRRLS